jgi:hypothetical protein
MRRNWKTDAKTAITELRSIPHGAREAEMRAIASHLNGHSDTSSLRRAISAYQFLEDLRNSNSVAYSAIENAPLTIVELIARWHGFDQIEAFRICREWADGIGNVRTIRKAMLDARPAGYAGKTGPTLEKAYVVAAEKTVIEAVRKLAGSKFSLSVSPTPDSESGQWIDFLFKPERSVSPQIAVVIVGPYNNPKLYLNRCVDWVLRAFGLSLLYDHIILALPDFAAMPEFERRIAAFSIIATKRQPKKKSSKSVVLPKVSALHIDAPKFAPVDEEALAQISHLY